MLCQLQHTMTLYYMTLIPVIENGDINRGFVADLRQLIIDAIKSGKFELVPGDNDLKLTGDGGGLHKARPMTALFVQSLMRTSGAQSLDAIHSPPEGIIRECRTGLPDPEPHD